MNTRFLPACSLILVFAFVLSACGGPQTGSAAGGRQGTLSVSGAFAIYPLMVTWAEAYQADHPGVRIDISAGGAGKGMADTLSGAVDIGMVSREIKPAELEQGAFGIPIARDAVFVTANAQNPALPDLFSHGLTAEKLAELYLYEQTVTWDQISGGAGAGQEVHVYTRSDSAGAAEIFALYFGATQEELRGVGVFGDPGILEAVIKDPLGIGYNNLNYVFDAETGLPVSGAAVVPLDINGDGRIDEAEKIETKSQAIAAVAENRYPSPPARTLYLVTKGKPAGLLADFLSWILTDGQVYVGEAGYVALPESTLNTALESLK